MTGTNEKRPDHIKFSGRILFLTDDTTLIRRQLETTGETAAALEAELASRLSRGDLPLMSNISTDEITPGWVCFYYDETLGQYVYVGMREGAVKKDEVKIGGFAVVVSGLSKGCGSSRETAPYAEKAAGIQLVIAQSIEKIYGQNSQNIGLLTSTDFGLIDRIRRGEDIPLSEFTKGLDPISQEIVSHGGLFNYNKARLSGKVSPPPLETGPRPMTIVEKIIARHAFVTAGKIGVEAVKPGDALFALADVRFSHEYVTPMAESLFKQALGADARVTDPESVFAFRDHLTFLGRVMSPKHREMGLLEKAEGLATTQQSFHHAAKNQALRREPRRWLGSDLSQRGRRRSRAAGTDRDRHGLAHVHGRRARLLRVWCRFYRHGERVVHERHSHPRAGNSALRSQRQEAR